MVEQVTQLFQYTRQVLESDMDQHPHKRHFYRLTLPQHFTGVNGTGAQYTDRLSGEWGVITLLSVFSLRPQRCSSPLPCPTRGLVADCIKDNTFIPEHAR